MVTDLKGQSDDWLTRLTRYVIALPLFNCPTAEDAIRAFGTVRARFHAIPYDLIVDEGAQFRHLFSRAPELSGTRCRTFWKMISHSLYRTSPFLSASCGIIWTSKSRLSSPTHIYEHVYWCIKCSCKLSASTLANVLTNNMAFLRR